MEIHLSDYRTLPEGDHNRWRKVLRTNYEAALRKVDKDVTTSVLGTLYHFSRRNEKIISVMSDV